MIDTLTANSSVTDMLLKSILKEVMSARVVKKSYKQKYQQAKVCATSTATPVTRDESAVTSPTTGITTTAVVPASEGLKKTTAVKSKVAVSRTSTAATGKTTGNINGPPKNTRRQIKNMVFELLSFIQQMEESNSNSEFENFTESVDFPTVVEADQKHQL